MKLTASFHGCMRFIMESKLKEAIESLDGYSYIIGAVSDDGDTGVGSKGTTKEITELVSKILAEIIKNAVEDVDCSKGQAFNVVIKEVIRATMTNVIADQLLADMDTETALDPDLLKGLKEDLLC